MERKDNSVRNPGQSEHYVDRPELAVIPRARLVAKQSNIPIKLATNNGIDFRSVHPMLGHWRDADRTFLAEAYRSAGTSILFSTSGAESPQVLLITSPHPQCGKTTTTANLAVSLAEGGRRVLLIDGDLRRPALAQFFGVQNSEGLTNVIDESERADLDRLIQSTAFPGVHILPSGIVKESVAKVLHSQLLGSVIDVARSTFDFIFIDAPPLLGLADARILSKFTDGVILICRAGQTSVDDLDEARRLLVEDGTHILGTILNGYDHKREGSTHGTSYSKYIGKNLA
jgi:capsular exopolysaccharide synthesis family protein